MRNREVVIHRGPPLHPDDVTTHMGIPVTSPSRTLIDCAEFMTAGELRAAFARARELGLTADDRSSPGQWALNGVSTSQCARGYLPDLL